ncbi:MAG: glucuronate isomerase [Chitinophagia bacterium]|nr:glucuronate isomerase [Chitinophagia bacterium]
MSTTSKHFIHQDFLLQSDLAQKLYFDYAADQPIIDFHSHLSPADIATNKKFDNISQVWLAGDHYKWRAMRTFGINEKFITGNAGDDEKFNAWAKTVPHTLRNPLFHWTHLELKNSFGVTELLNEKNSSQIYEHCNSLLRGNDHTSRKFLEKYKVVYQATTDDPTDDLRFHQMAQRDSSFSIQLVPSFRPDKAFSIHDPSSFIKYLSLLSEISGILITDMNSLLEALKNRVDFFHDNGCRISDHGLQQIPLANQFSTKLESEFKAFLSSKGAQPFSDPDAFVFHVLESLAKMYHQKGWVQQFHLGAIRNNNSRLLSTLGADVGVDSIGDFSHAARLSAFLNVLDKEDKLTKTIIYNLNPADNAVFASMTGNFNDGSVRGKVQYGPAWWFLDQKNGMEEQLDVLSDMGLLSCFVGMITDSRSLLSFSRHEYFRRILCNLLANDMLSGILPNDEKWVGGVITSISYLNAKEYLSI